MRPRQLVKAAESGREDLLMEDLVSQVCAFSDRYLTSPDARISAVFLVAGWCLWSDGKFPDEVAEARERLIDALLHRAASQAGGESS